MILAEFCCSRLIFSKISMPWLVFVVSRMVIGEGGANWLISSKARYDSPTDAAWIQRSARGGGVARVLCSKPGRRRLLNLRQGRKIFQSP